MAPVRGFADLHTHPVAHRGFGGKVVVGEPWSSKGVHEALKNCEGAGAGHASFTSAQALLSWFVRHFSERHGACGAPTFQHWPSHTTMYHQQMYVDFIRRAHAHGLRLMCALAVNNELLARTARAVRYSDFNMIESQVRALDAFVRDVRSTSEAAGEAPWLDLAESPAEARAIIARGELAIVRGVEVDSLDSLARHVDIDEPTHLSAGPSVPTRDLRSRPLQAEEIKRVLDQLKTWGISMITPIHLADNSFGGAAIYDDRFDLLQEWLRGRPYDEVVTRSVAFRLGTTDRLQRMAMRAIAQLKDTRTYRLATSGRGHRNSATLTEVGRRFLEEAMKSGFIIDVDHMSEKTTDAALSLATAHRYPVISSHSSFRDLGYWRHESADALGLTHEGMKTPEQVDAILSLGGVVAPITNQHRCKAHGSTVANGIGTSRAYAQAFLYAVDRAKKLGRGGVAFGTDFNGLAQQPGPRFPAEDSSDPPRRLRYGTSTWFNGTPLLQDVLAGRARPFDLNQDGLAHYGLLGDFIEDLRTIDVPDAAVDMLFDSAEAFLQMWEACELRGRELV